MPRRDQLFETITTEGALLPSDFLQRLAQRDREIEGLTADAYHLGGGEKLNEAISRSWNRLLGVWKNFSAATQALPPSDLGTTLTREKWLLPLFQELGYGRLQTSKPFEFDDRKYSISHGWQAALIHLVSFRADLDERSESIVGARRSTPHSMVQEFLNRCDAHLWGIVSNGLRLRLLRDNVSITRQAFVEFDLEGMMQGELYADFALLWLLLHQSRVEGERPELCWLEKWTQEARQQGERVLDHMRDGVQDAITALGQGFLAHPANTALRDRLRSGELTTQDYFRQLLRVVYRFLFLCIAEDRDLLHAPGVPATARERYRSHYSITRLRRMAQRLGGTQHSDLWHIVQFIVRSLGSKDGCPTLGLTGLGSFLWSERATPALADCQLPNRQLLQSIRSLAYTQQGRFRRPVDYKNIGSQEFGSVYESLLEQHPKINLNAATFTLGTHAGNERKTSGTHYTPPPLVSCLLDSALEPVLQERERDFVRLGFKSAEDAILSLKVCDTAVGSGHFLIGAAHRMAKRLAAVRTGDGEPAPAAVRHALRDVIGRCLYGVDINPMAVELCKFALWLEALEPGKPLSFLDHHIQCGNSLLGATPALMAHGIPDAAFEPIEGDDKKYCANFKKENRKELQQETLFDRHERPWEHLGNLAVGLAQLASLPDDSVADVHAKESRYAELVRSSGYESGRQLADSWCAAFLWKKCPPAAGGFDYPITNDVFQRLERNPHDAPKWMREEIERLAEQYHFFHWHLAFPDVFQIPRFGKSPENAICGWNGGFDVSLGNPPWVRQELLKPFKRLLVEFASFTSTADSSVFFLERALHTTRLHGRIAMLTPNKWFRANYAEKLRRILRSRSRIHLLVDFGHSRNLFPDADTFPAAVACEPTPSAVPDSDTAAFVQAHDSQREQYSLPELIRDHAIQVPHGNLRQDRWHLEDSGASDLLTRLLSSGSPLEPSLTRPLLSGLKSGFNEAFYVETSLRDSLVAADPKCGVVFKKFLRGRDVKRWVPAWDGQWHIVIPSSQNRSWPWSSAEGEAQAEAIFERTYPTVHAHLKRFEQPLRQRQDKGNYWWELRSCDYYTDFERPKVLVQCIAYYSQFALDDAGHYVNNKVIVIPTDDLFLLAILNSRVTWWIVNRTFQHMKDEGLSVDVQFLKRLPIPKVTHPLRQSIEEVTREILAAPTSAGEPSRRLVLETRLNSLVNEAFQLSAQEQQVMVESLPPRDPLDSLHSDDEQAAPQRSSIEPKALPLVAMPDLQLPTGARKSAPNPQVYLMQLTILLLHRNQGTLTLDRMLDACALLSLPDMLVEHAVIEFGDVAKRWRSRFREQILPGLFLPILRDLIDRGIIRLKPDGSGTLVVLADASAVPKNPEVEFDAGLALRVVNLLPAPELEALPEMIPYDELVEFCKVA